MAAYAAVISLKHTLDELPNSPYISLASVSSTTDEDNLIRFTYEALTSVQEDLRRLDKNRSSSRRIVESLDGQIRDAVYKLEDVFDSHVSKCVSEKELIISFEEVREEINSWIEELKKATQEYVNELDNPSSSPPPSDGEEDEDGDVVVVVDGKKLKVVGFDDSKVEKIKEELTEIPFQCGVVSFVGAAGTGRTFLARVAFEKEDDIQLPYERRAWASLGAEYDIKDIISTLISQLQYDGSDDDDDDGDEERLAEKLHTCLKGRKYLIVLDNVCETHVWDYLKICIPPQDNGSLVVLTTGLEEVAQYANSFKTYRIDVLNEEASWDIIRELVLGEEDDSCQLPELEEAAKQIARNCEGLPLGIIKAAFMVSKAQKSPQSWTNIAADQKQNRTDAYDEMLQVSQIKELLTVGNSFWDYIFDADDASRTYFYKVIHSALQPNYLVDVVEDLFPDYVPIVDHKMVALYGMAGIGKTSFAREMFEDPSISRHFDHRVWVKLGPKYRYDRILVDILAQLDPNIDRMTTKGDDILAKRHFRTMMYYKRCLLVLDDVWSKEVFRYLDCLFKGMKFSVLLTTRLFKVASQAYFNYSHYHKMSLLSMEKSWCLFCEKVFGGKCCPAELEKPGRLIVENCEGLPLMIVTVASLLCQAEKTKEFWYKVAMKKNSVFERAYDEISKILLPSYEYLHQYLKPCFLYMGVFPLKCEIHPSKLLGLWRSEGILESDFSRCLGKLDSNSVLMVHRNYDGKIKRCYLHSVFWHLCVRKARDSKFFHVLNRITDASAEYMNGQRRLCIQNNVLFAIKDVHTSIASNSTARSLLCTGPYHQYPVPICFSFPLLRILDTLTIRFYEFPIAACDLVRLRYLALTCHGDIPASISRFWNLQYLIVGEHLSTRLLNGGPVYFPMEIWDMKQLKHLQAVGRDLPDPCGAVLPNLLTLLDVSPHSCTQSVILGIPNLEKLRLRIELRPDASESLFSFDHISSLHRLRSLKCVIVNPEIIVPPHTPISMLPSSLRKLTLGGFGYPWEYMSIIRQLHNLKVLKLQNYAFQGPEWLMPCGDSWDISYLLIEDTDLAIWRCSCGCSRGCEAIPRLQELIIRNCYKLREFPRLNETATIKLIDCHPERRNNMTMDVPLYGAVHSSWE